MCLLPCSQRNWTHSYNARMRSLQLRWNSSIPSCRPSVLQVKDSLSQVLGGILCENHAQGAFSNGIVRGTLSPLHSLNWVPRIRHIYPTGFSCTAFHNIVQIGRCPQCASSLLFGFLRNKVNVCGLCIEVNCLYLTIERELSLGEYLKKITFSCIAVIALRCYASRLQDQLSPLSFYFPAKQSMFLAPPFGMSSLSLLFR